MKISSYFNPITRMFTNLSKRISRVNMPKLSKSTFRFKKPKVELNSQDTFVRAEPASMHLISSKAQLPATSALFKAYERAKEDREERIRNPVTSPSFEAEMARHAALKANLHAAKLFYEGSQAAASRLQWELHQAEQKLGPDNVTVIELKERYKAADDRLDKACGALVAAEMATF